MQNKTPGEVAAILKEWHEVNERCKQKAGETEELMLECDRLLEKIRCHLFEYAVRAMSFSPTIDSNNLSMVELILRNGAMEHDRKAGAATWALYETQKKLQDFCNAFEELQTFHAEYVVPDTAGEIPIQATTIALATIRQYLRGLGPGVIKTREHILSLMERPE
jgi:hypothetical protein